MPTKPWLHPLSDRQAVEDAIRQGNSPLFEITPARNLSIKKEILDSRPHQVAAHHWTEAEFVAFLDEHRYPPNTYRDRLFYRLTVIRDALVNGLYVPPEVMHEAETATAIEGAIMEIRFAESAARANAAQAENVARFELELGDRKSELVRLACLAPATYFQNGLDCTIGRAKRFSMADVSMPLVVIQMTAPEYSRYHLNKRWFAVKDSRYPDPSLFGELKRIEHAAFESECRKLLELGQLTLTQARTLMGETWMPYTRVTQTTGLNLSNPQGVTA